MRRALRILRWLPILAVALATAPEAAEGSQHVLLIGDSITWGMVSGEPGPPYAEVLAELLGPGYEVIDAGCGGATSLDWTLSQPDVICGGVGVLEGGLYEERARPYLPVDIATVLLGTNDAVGFFEPVPIEVPVYAAAMNEIVWNLLADRARWVILMTAPDHDWADPAAVARLAGYRDEIRALCASHPRVVCGPDLYELLDLELDFAPGDVHPNATGHARIASELARTITTGPPAWRCGLGPELALLLPALAWVRRRRGAA